MEEKKLSSGIIWLLIILCMIIFGLTGFIIYVKVVDKDDRKIGTKTDDIVSVETNNDNEEKILNLDSEEIKKLKNVITNTIFEKSLNMGTFSALSSMLNSNLNVSTMSEKEKLELIFYLYMNKFNYIDMESYTATKQMVAIIGGYTYNKYVEESEVENYFHLLYGPDADYHYAYELDFGFSNFKYDLEKRHYDYGTTNFGGSPAGNQKFQIDDYKVEQYDDKIFLYSYVYSSAEIATECVVYGDCYQTVIWESNTQNCDNVDYTKLKEDGKIKTYKSIYKKQSDGKYYFVEGVWQ